MSAHAHRGRYAKFIGLAVASAAGGLIAVSPALGVGGNGKRDIELTKVASVATIIPGGVVQYDLKVKNTGELPIALKHLNVVDPWADSDPVFVGTDDQDTGNLKVGKTALFQATKTFPTDLALCGTTAQNTAFAVVEPPGQNGPPADVQNSSRKSSKSRKASNAANNDFAWVVKSATSGVLVTGGTCPVPPPVVPSVAAATALRPAALVVEKTGPARALAGGFVNFQIRVTNTGQTDAPNVVLADLPSRFLAWRSVPTGATVSGRNAEWAIGTLGAGQSVTKTVSFRARLSASGQVCNTATATSTTAGAALDRACVTVAAARRPATPVTG